ncbi:MAG: hypothetical protein JEY96_16990 [Bacteroidales bacterium]|nr:hypothetical protein [Bacteroidales bacterium]
MRAYIRYYLKYEPDVLESMTMQQLAEAFQDLLYIRSHKSKFEPEE